MKTRSAFALRGEGGGAGGQNMWKGHAAPPFLVDDGMFAFLVRGNREREEAAVARRAKRAG